jgi:hypothetical protein
VFEFSSSIRVSRIVGSVVKSWLWPFVWGSNFDSGFSSKLSSSSGSAEGLHRPWLTSVAVWAGRNVGRTNRNPSTKRTALDKVHALPISPFSLNIYYRTLINSSSRRSCRRVDRLITVPSSGSRSFWCGPTDYFRPATAPTFGFFCCWPRPIIDYMILWFDWIEPNGV